MSGTQDLLEALGERFVQYTALLLDLRWGSNKGLTGEQKAEMRRQAEENRRRIAEAMRKAAGKERR